jgi:hypothetical protein
MATRRFDSLPGHIPVQTSSRLCAPETEEPTAMELTALPMLSVRPRHAPVSPTCSVSRSQIPFKVTHPSWHHRDVSSENSDAVRRDHCDA